MSLKSLITGFATAAVVAGAALGITSITVVSPIASSPAVMPAVHGAPLPQQGGPAVPSADQLSGILYGLANPGVPFKSKSGLVEGGVGIFEARTADRLLANANAEGLLPLSFQVSNITAGGPGVANASVTASGPQTQPVTQTVTFVDQGGWKLSRASATSLLQSALAAG